MCVCMYMHIYVYVYVQYIYIYTHTQTHTYIHTYIYTHSHTHRHTHRHKHTHTHTHKHKHTHAHTYIHTYIYICIYTWVESVSANACNALKTQPYNDTTPNPYIITPCIAETFSTASPILPLAPPLPTATLAARVQLCAARARASVVHAVSSWCSCQAGKRAAASWGKISHSMRVASMTGQQMLPVLATH